MRLLSWLISLPILGAVVIFVLQNREPVGLSFWPFDVQIAMPVSVLALGLLIMGIFIGALLASFTTLAAMRTVRKQKRDIAALNKKLEAQPVATVAVPASFIGGAYKTIPPVVQVPTKSSMFQKLFRTKGS